MDDTTPEGRRAQLIADLQDHTIYELVGGEAAVRALVNHFYDLMDGDLRFADIRSMHATDLAPMRVSLFEYLSGWLGGPQLFIERHGSPCIARAHAPYSIGQRERDLWLECMDDALVMTGIGLGVREALMPGFTNVADMMRNDHVPAGARPR